MGLSTVADWIKSSDDMLSMLLEFIKFILPDETFLLAGESYGAYLSRGIMAKIPDRVEGALLICPVIKPFKDRILPKPTVLVENPNLLTSLPREDREKYESIAVIQDEETFSLYKKNIIPGLNIANFEFLNRLCSKGYAFSFDVDAPDSTFDKPLLLLTGRQDSNVGYEDAWGIMKNYPRGSYVLLDRAGHCLEIEQRILFRSLTEEWLMRCEEHRR